MVDPVTTPRVALGYLLVLLAGSGCAPSLRVLAGSSQRAPLSVTARATCSVETARLSLRLDNGSEDPIAVDLDRLAVRSGAGDVLRVLGRPQRFRGDGVAAIQRVPNELVVVVPHGHAEAELELPPLPARGPFSLQIPALHRLGMDGQRPLPSMQVPLRLDEAASAEASRNFDPFEE